MTRQEAYVAELNQLLFYMTPWDKAKVLKGITAMINHPETGVQTMEEMGSPMKLAVTLHRQYTPTPEPTAEELAAEAEAEVPGEELNETVEETVEEEIAEVADEEEPVAEAEEAIEEEPDAEAEEAIEEEPAAEAEEAAEEEPVAEAEEAIEEEPVAEAEEAIEEEPVAEAEEAIEEEPAAEAEETVEEETAPKEALFSSDYVDRGAKETIFAEIFNAVEEAHAAPAIEVVPVKETKRKARYLFLIPYVIFAVVVGIPATLVFGIANLAVLSASLVSLGGMIYLALFGLGVAVGLSSKLIVLGMTILMLALTIALWVMTVWFLQTATIGFPRFLVEVAKTHGYREVEVQ